MPGFDFSNHNRNAALHARGVPLPKATSTGTTIVGCIYDGGVVVSLDIPGFEMRLAWMAMHLALLLGLTGHPDRGRYKSNKRAHRGGQGT